MRENYVSQLSMSQQESVSGPEAFARMAVNAWFAPVMFWSLLGTTSLLAGVAVAGEVVKRVRGRGRDEPEASLKSF